MAAPYPEEKVERVIEEVDGKPLKGPNDLVFDAEVLLQSGMQRG